MDSRLFPFVGLGGSYDRRNDNNNNVLMHLCGAIIWRPQVGASMAGMAWSYGAMLV